MTILPQVVRVQGTMGILTLSYKELPFLLKQNGYRGRLPFFLKQHGYSGRLPFFLEQYGYRGRIPFFLEQYGYRARRLYLLFQPGFRLVLDLFGRFWARPFRRQAESLWFDLLFPEQPLLFPA